MSKLDATDLALLDVLASTGSVSETAHALGLSQPSISIRLGKLRRHFNDRLFVRTTDGMRATPRALALLAPVRTALALFQGTEGQPEVFDPPSATRLFRICMTNTGQMVVLAPLLNRLSDVAPHLRVEVSDLDASTPGRLESGEADLAMGYTQEMQTGFYQQKLFTEYYVCLVRRDHPRIKRKLALEQFTRESHVAVKTTGTAHWILDKAIDDAGITRNVTLWVPSFLGLAQIVAQTSLLALVPIHLARILCEHSAVRFLEVPFSMPSYVVRQYWHERYHRDAGNQWLRKVLADVLVE